MITRLDTAILLWIHEHLAHPVADAVMAFITRLGDAGFCWILLALVLLCIPKTRKAGAAIAIALTLTLLIGNLALKPLVARVRPFLANPSFALIIAPPSGFSFPSGHTMASFASACALLGYSKRAGFAALALAVLIAFSRLYLLVHYPTDVLAGAVIGAAIGFLAVKIQKALQKRISVFIK